MLWKKLKFKTVSLITAVALAVSFCLGAYAVFPFKYKSEILREYWNYEDTLSSAIEECLNKNKVKRENIVSIKTFSENDYIYCMIIWEE